MKLDQLQRVSRIECRVADQTRIAEMDEKVFEQITKAATLPGIVEAAYAMPDAHWGYGFPIGGVAEEEPGAYKNVGAVVEAAARPDWRVQSAKLRPLICTKG